MQPVPLRLEWEREDKKKRLTRPSLNTIQASVGGPPLTDSTAVMLNLIFSFKAAFSCFLELMPWATPVTVGIAASTRSPSTILFSLGRACRSSLGVFQVGNRTSPVRCVWMKIECLVEVGAARGENPFGRVGTSGELLDYHSTISYVLSCQQDVSSVIPYFPQFLQL